MTETVNGLHLECAKKILDSAGHTVKIVDKFQIDGQGLQDIVPVRAGYIKCAPRYAYGPFVRDSWTLQYVCGGRGTVRKNGAELTARAGDCFILRPGEEVTLTADPDAGWTYIWIGFRSTVALPALWYKRDVLAAPDLEELFLEIANLSRLPGGPADELLVSFIWRLIYHFRCQETRSGPGFGDALLHVEDACRLIRENCAGVTVQQLADTLNLNRSYLSRIFKESTGLSLQAYISNARLRTARDLLLKNHTVAQTAAMVGYSDVPSFSRAFKGHYRLSPREYVKRRRRSIPSGT